MGWGVHTITFVMVIFFFFAAGRPNRQTSKMCVIFPNLVDSVGARPVCHVTVTEIKVLE